MYRGTSLLIAFYLSVGTSGPAVACDDLLLALLYGREERTEFETAIEEVSGGLGTLGSQVKKGHWDAARDGHRRAVKAWLGIYQKFLTRPPESLKGHPDWAGTLKRQSHRIGGLKALLDAKDQERLHAEVRAIQHSLVQGYLEGWTIGAVPMVHAVLDPLNQVVEQIDAVGYRRTGLTINLGVAQRRFETLSGLEGAEEMKGWAAELQQTFTSLFDRLRNDQETGVIADVKVLRSEIHRFGNRYLTGIGLEPLGDLPDAE